MNVLDPKVKRDLLSWFVKLQLSEYLVLFAEGEDVSIQSFDMIFENMFQNHSL